MAKGNKNNMNHKQLTEQMEILENKMKVLEEKNNKLEAKVLILESRVVISVGYQPSFSLNSIDWINTTDVPI